MLRDTLALSVVILSILMPLTPLLVSFDSDTGISTDPMPNHRGTQSPDEGTITGQPQSPDQEGEPDQADTDPDLAQNNATAEV